MFIVPGVTRPGTRCVQPVSLLDVYPTLNELCGLPRRDDLDGESLVPLLKDPAARRNRPAVTTWGRGNHSVRTLHWRYIRHANGTEELYDHREDPDEFTNLVSSQPEKSKPIISGLKKWLPAPTKKRP
jgi:arylsulfatase A-like enzyme